MREATPSSSALNLNKLTLIPVLGVATVLAGHALALFAQSSVRGSRLVDGLFVALASVLSCVFALALLPMARRASGLHGAWAVALALGAQGLLPLFCAMVALGEPYIASHWRCGTGDAVFVILAPMVASAAGVFALLLARVGLPRLGAGLARALRALAIAVLAASVAVVGLGATRVMQRPTAPQYLAQMPIAGTVPAITVTPRMAPRVDMVGRILVWRQCVVDHGCELRLRAPTLTHESIDGRMMRVGAGALRVRTDDRVDLVLIEGDVSLRTMAFRRSTAAPIDVSWSTLAAVVAPPTAWLALALAGLLVALLAWAQGGASLRSLARWRGAREATLTEHGAVTFGEDVPAAKVQGEVALAPGPVLVRDDATAAHLRAMATVPSASLRAGTLRELADAIALADGGRYVLAATIAAWSAAPLAITLLG